MLTASSDNIRARKRKQSADVEVEPVQPQSPTTVTMPFNQTLSPSPSAFDSSFPASFSSALQSAAVPAPPSSSSCKQSDKLRKKRKTGRRTLTDKEIDELLANEEWDVIRNEEDGQDSNMRCYDSCNEVRRKIRAFIRSGRMNQTKLMKFLNVNPGSWHNYMRLVGSVGDLI